MDIHESFHRNGLHRPTSGRVIGGVCAGLAQKVGLHPWGVRGLFILILLLVEHDHMVLAYAILWILMPSERTATPPPPLPQPQADDTPAPTSSTTV